MSYRYMRIIVFFDLPSVTYHEKKVYVKFHDFLDNEGFIMLQESVYTKLVLNGSVSKSVMKKVRDNAPSKGLVQVLTVTEKQFAQIECITGSYHSNKMESDERLVIL